MQLHFAEYGSDLPDTLVILHGLLGSERNWHSLAKIFAAHVRVLVPDLRNHGASPHDPDHSIRSMRQDLEEFVEWRRPDRFFLLGHSMGGHVAMDYAFHAAERLRGLIVEDIAPRSYGTGLTRTIRSMMTVDLQRYHEKRQIDEALRDDVPDTVVRHFLLTNLVRHEHTLAWRVNLPALLSFAENEIARFRAEDLHRYDGPTLFIGGGRSVYNISREERLIFKHFPRARIEMVEQANHWVHFDAKESFTRLVVDFLRANGILPG
jgi:pimeloyl-ACP methyl ester carboxylesterase